MQVRKIIFTILLLLSLNLKAASTKFYSNSTQSAKISILSTFDQDNNIILGIHFKINNDWYIYSPDKNNFYPEPKFNFTGSDNINIHNYNVLWPKSKKNSEQFGDDIHYFNIYENEVIIPIKLNVIDKNKDVEINLEINYGICNKICIPVKDKFSIVIKKNDIDHRSLSKMQKFSNDIVGITNYKHFLKIIIFAFIGGLILNIMPCVLPVLSVKLISIIKYRNLKKSRVRKIYFATISSFSFHS